MPRRRGVPTTLHVVEFGLQDDTYELQTEVSNTSDWINGPAQSRFSAFGGTTELRGAYVQDTWALSPRWLAVLGLRQEWWEARDGSLANATTTLAFPHRTQDALSPKAALRIRGRRQLDPQGLRRPRVAIPHRDASCTGHDFDQTSSSTTIPCSSPEVSTTSELSWVRTLKTGRLRATLFAEQTRDALYSQTNVTVVPNLTSIQNVGYIRTKGFEVATDFQDVGIEALDLLASVTFADSIIEENPNLPASVGKWQPRVPRWRANLLATYHAGCEQWTFTADCVTAASNSTRSTNSETQSDAYTGTSPFLVADARCVFRYDAHWSAALGVDNLTNRTYWNFHPYNQRTWNAEVRFDY
jgi:iron complex outermembrane receptor protein